ncbi:hypothetical protein BSKO_07181 [Bryopsis sp. KO-2023]|nr:hypothetical protein BSKO_07181 [Bryopsis sp. KO-2023]
MQARMHTGRPTAFRASAFAGNPVRIGRVGRAERASRKAFQVNAYLGQYLSEAVQKIFSVPDDEPVQWQKTATPYSGKISRDDHSRLRRLSEVVEAVKGCTNVDAENYDESATLDDGSCVFVPGAEPSKAGMQTYLTDAVERVFGHQFKGDDTEPNWQIAPFDGDIHTQRDIERMVSFSKVVKKTLEDVEVES